MAAPFVDTAKITVRSGNGGSGVVSFHREPGFQMMEFRNWEYFQAAIDQYTQQRYRYQ